MAAAGVETGQWAGAGLAVSGACLALSPGNYVHTRVSSPPGALSAGLSKGGGRLRGTKPPDLEPGAPGGKKNNHFLPACFPGDLREEDTDRESQALTLEELLTLPSLCLSSPFGSSFLRFRQSLTVGHLEESLPSLLWPPPK